MQELHVEHANELILVTKTEIHDSNYLTLQYNSMHRWSKDQELKILSYAILAIRLVPIGQFDAWKRKNRTVMVPGEI